MKCFTVKVGDNSYIDNVSRVIPNGYYARNEIIRLTNNENDAKHYKTKGQASGWLKTSIKKCEGRREEYTKNLKKELAGYYQTILKEKLDGVNDLIKRLTQDSRVVELDVEIPNFYDKNGLKFNEWYRKYNRGGMELRCDNTSKYHCKVCGVKLKNIPYYIIPNSNNFRIGVCCLYLRKDNIISAFESMPKSLQNDIIAELTIGSL